MADILVTSVDTLSFNGNEYACAIGKAGFTHDKREGDNKTPIGRFALRECWVRADRVQTPETSLHIRTITKQDGWCDDPEHPAYNTHVKLPFASRHERLWRDDHAYDIIVSLGYNDDPIIPGKGSAIFLHVAQPDFRGTEGCVALAEPDLRQILRALTPETHIHIAPHPLY